MNMNHSDKSIKSLADEFELIGEQDLFEEKMLTKSKKRDKIKKAKPKKSKIKEKEEQFSDNNEIEFIIFDEESEDMIERENSGIDSVRSNTEENSYNSLHEKAQNEEIELKPDLNFVEKPMQLEDNIILNDELVQSLDCESLNNSGKSTDDNINLIDVKNELGDEIVDNSYERNDLKLDEGKDKFKNKDLIISPINEKKNSSKIQALNRSKRESIKSSKYDVSTETLNKRRKCTQANDPLRFIKKPVSTPTIGLRLGLSRRGSLNKCDLSSIISTSNHSVTSSSQSRQVGLSRVISRKEPLHPELYKNET